MMFHRSGLGLFQFGRQRPHGSKSADEILQEIVGKGEGLPYLRRVLQSELGPDPVASMTDREVVQAVALHVRTGKIAIVTRRPRDSHAEAFFVEGDGTAPVAGPKNKAGDLKPAPEIPPEYPVLARVESDQVIDSTLKLVAELAALMFQAFDGAKRRSTLARTFINVASDEGSSIAIAKDNVDAVIGQQYYPGGNLDRPKPSVPVEFVAAATTTGQTAKFEIQALGRSLEPESQTSSKPKPALPDEYVSVASGTASGTKSTAVALGASLADAFRVEPFVRVRASAAPEANP